MRRLGFTLIELALTIVIVAILTAAVFPRIRVAADKANVRSARVFLSSSVAMARAASVQRDCRAVLHVQSGTAGRVWITACPRTQAGAGTVDTLGAVPTVGSRFGVTVTSSRDSIQYDPRGISMDLATTILGVTGSTPDGRDSLVVNPLGLAIR